MILQLRTALFWMHLAVGVVAGLFILNMAISGISIAYSKQITAWAESGQRIVTVPPNAARLDVEALVAKVQDERPNARLSGVVIQSDPTAAAMFNVGREGGVLFVNPYTGDVQGEGQKAVRGFFQFMTSWHRWLALGATARPIGETITGTVAILYFFMLVSGLIIWLPQQWSRRRVRRSALIDPKLRGKARDWNWHNVVGLWCSPLLLFVTLTAIIMSHNWANNLLYRMTGNPVPEPRRESARAGGHNEGPAPRIDLSGVNPLWAQAEKKVDGWHSITLRFSNSTDAPATFMIDRGDGSRPDTAAQLSLDRDTGEVVRWLPYEKENGGQKLRAWVRPIHTGEAGGIIGQSIIVIAALGGITLVWTGLSMAWRRFFGQREPVAQTLSTPSTPIPTPL